MEAIKTTSAASIMDDQTAEFMENIAISALLLMVAIVSALIFMVTLGSAFLVLYIYGYTEPYRIILRPRMRQIKARDSARMVSSIKPS